MGTDIYLYAEVRDEHGWKPVPEPVQNEYSDEHELIPCEALELGRPYGLFSVLSGGSVGLGAANDQIPGISEPRGFPEDMNDFYTDYFKTGYEAQGGDYGASWLMLSELIDFDWNQTVSRFAYVEKKYAKMFDKNKAFPAEFPEEGKLYHGLFKEPPEGTEKVHWSISVANYVGCHEHVIEELERLGPKDRLRIIYFFNC